MPKVLPLKDAYEFASQNELQAEVDKIRDMDMNPQVITTNSLRRTVRKGYMVSLLQDKGLWKQFIQNYWPDGSTTWGEQRTKHYLDWKMRNLNNENEEDGQDDEAKEGIEQHFGYEKELRDFLKNNLHVIEPWP